MLARMDLHFDDPNLLLGVADDAGVYRLDATTALVQTVDFFTPIVDDPYFFGRIAAVNAMSDLYAMGARPLLALNLVAFPQGKYQDMLEAILRGGVDALREAGAVLMGGHTIDDVEPKYGMAVTGLAHPDRVWTKAGARPGDVLYLTKPVGTGVISRGIKDAVAPEAVIAAATRSMARLNRDAAEAARECGGPDAATDVTGFGLLGHAWEMARESSVTLCIEASAVPVLDGAYALAEAGVVPGGSLANLAFVEPHLAAGGVHPVTLTLLADAVTAGGLLLAIDPARTGAFEQAARARSVDARRIGTVMAGSPQLVVTP